MVVALKLYGSVEAFSRALVTFVPFSGSFKSVFCFMNASVAFKAVCCLGRF